MLRFILQHLLTRRCSPCRPSPQQLVRQFNDEEVAVTISANPSVMYELSGNEFEDSLGENGEPAEGEEKAEEEDNAVVEFEARAPGPSRCGRAEKLGARSPFPFPLARLPLRSALPARSLRSFLSPPS